MSTLSAESPAVRVPTQQLIRSMLHGRDRVSDLIFSPGRAPQVEERGELIELPFEGIEQLTPAQTIQIAEDLIGANQIATQQLTKSGSADLSYALTGVARFRVNIFRQRSSCAIVMRVIPSSVPSFDDLRLPPVLQEIVPLRNGIVLVTGPTGSGKSSTLAAVVDRMNETRAIHILTIEDPIEFMHSHKKATIHQRELHGDVPTMRSTVLAASMVCSVDITRWPVSEASIAISIAATLPFPSESGIKRCDTMKRNDCATRVRIAFSSFLGNTPMIRSTVFDASIVCNVDNTR